MSLIILVLSTATAKPVSASPAAAKAIYASFINRRKILPVLEIGRICCSCSLFLLRRIRPILFDKGQHTFISLLLPLNSMDWKKKEKLILPGSEPKRNEKGALAPLFDLVRSCYRNQARCALTCRIRVGRRRQIGRRTSTHSVPLWWEPSQS